MLTWTTYGTWLQGDKRGWVKNGRTYGPLESLENANRQIMMQDSFKLDKVQRQIAADAIVQKAAEIEQRIHALAVCSNHVHIVVDCVPIEIGKIASYYKNAAKFALKDDGFEGKLWTKGFDKRYCDDAVDIGEKVKYVLGHVNGVLYKS